MNLFGFVLFSTVFDSWTWMTISFLSLGMFSTVLHAGVVPVGWLGLLLARGPGLTEIGWLGYLDTAAVHTIHV